MTSVIALPRPVAAVLFDLDGVLTATAGVHAAAWQRLFDGFLPGLPGPAVAPFDPVDDYARYIDGRPRVDGVRAFLAARGIDLPEGSPGAGPGADTVHALAARKDQIFSRLLREDGVAVYPDAVRFLTAVRGAGLRTAVVSASRHCAQIIASAGLDDLLDVRVDGVVAAAEHLPGKPAPDVFLAAARRLDLPAARAAVVEDAVVGVAAGRAGGFGYVVGVDRIGADHGSALAKAGADVVVDGLARLLR